jgi:hypothetical protein
MSRATKLLMCLAIGIALVVVWQLGSGGQQPAGGKAAPTESSNRLEFEVVHSFDAKYQGDTPGHMGRAGALQNRHPHIALGDAVYRGEEKVGDVTGLSWNRANGSLDIEFDPVDNARICVGDNVWMMLDASAAANVRPNPSH